MRILVLEYILGGCLAGEPLPSSLATEARLMLQALLDDLQEVTDVDILLPLDIRSPPLNLSNRVEVVHIAQNHAELALLLEPLLDGVDAIWPIAPESHSVLQNIAEWSLKHDKILLASTPAAIANCADKYITCQLLAAQGLPVAVTELFNAQQNYATPAVIKPRDGLGCMNTQLIASASALQQLQQSLSAHDFLIQPYYSGQAISLSAIFYQGKADLLCCNQQQMGLNDSYFYLQGCLVNTDNPATAYYRQLLKEIAVAMPGLWGYIGIDLIETENGPIILEINPRLTSSYAGIRAATGINPAQRVLDLLTDSPASASNLAATTSVLVNLQETVYG